MTTLLAVAPRAAGNKVDPRGQRFAATATVALLAMALLLLGHPVGAVLLGMQTLAFALGVVRGPAGTPQAWLFRRFIAARIAPPTTYEDAAPPRFAQFVGLVFLLVADIAWLSGLPVLAAAAAATALAAALLNAAFGVCLGCEVYLLALRAWPGLRRQPRSSPAVPSQVGTSRVVPTPVGATPVGATPVGATPVGLSPAGGSPGAASTQATRL